MHCQHAHSLYIGIYPLYPTSVFFYNILSVVVVYNHDLIKVIVVVVVGSMTNPKSISLICTEFNSQELMHIYFSDQVLLQFQGACGMSVSWLGATGKTGTHGVAVHGRRRYQGWQRDTGDVILGSSCRPRVHTQRFLSDAQPALNHDMDNTNHSSIAYSLLQTKGHPFIKRIKKLCPY